jgi:hypothetical protein
MRFLAVILLLVASACNNGPCGDPAIECWTGDDSCPTKYTRYTGSGSCPQGYWCVDPREPIYDMAQVCTDLSSSVIDMSKVD